MNKEYLAERVKDLTEENERLKERDVPIKTFEQMIYNIDVHHCPKCEGVLVLTFKYCPFCGQRVKYTEVEEGDLDETNKHK